jgi:hypothetical protein
MAVSRERTAIREAEAAPPSGGPRQPLHAPRGDAGGRDSRYGRRTT